MSLRPKKLASKPCTILISEDEWLAELYPNEIRALDDYIRCSSRFRTVMGQHIQALLCSGISVVLDFQANTPKSRNWMRTLFEGAHVAHELHYLDVSDQTCKACLQKRNAEGKHRYQTSEADFDLITRHFVALTEDEAFHVIRYTETE